MTFSFLQSHAWSSWLTGGITATVVSEDFSARLSKTWPIEYPEKGKHSRVLEADSSNTITQLSSWFFGCFCNPPTDCIFPGLLGCTWPSSSIPRPAQLLTHMLYMPPSWNVLGPSYAFSLSGTTQGKLFPTVQSRVCLTPVHFQHGTQRCFIFWNIFSFHMPYQDASQVYLYKLGLLFCHLLWNCEFL